jgi:ribosome-associated toxin RatA of RatAB toxin-antitoxin module
MYALVEGIESYPEFLPWCAASRVHRRTDTETEATIELAFKGVRQAFTTVNANQAPSEIRLALKDGPFSKLQGQWRFIALGDGTGAVAGCKVSFELQYDFSSRAVAALIGSAFEKITATLLDAFVTRADAVYGAAA